LQFIKLFIGLCKTERKIWIHFSKVESRASFTKLLLVPSAKEIDERFK